MRQWQRRRQAWQFKKWSERESCDAEPAAIGHRGYASSVAGSVGFGGCKLQVADVFAVAVAPQDADKLADDVKCA